MTKQEQEQEQEFPHDAILSGWVIRYGKKEWYGCGTEDEFYEVLASDREEAAKHDQQAPRRITLTVATLQEIDLFRKQAGDNWCPTVTHVNSTYYVKE